VRCELPRASRIEGVAVARLRGGILEKIERCRRRLEEIKPGCTVRRGRKKVA
jgi:hypothetical protein